MLYDVKRLGLTNGYCGPFAAVTVTGKPWPEVRRAINRARGKSDNSPIFGLSTAALVAGLKWLGCEVSDPIEPLKGRWGRVEPVDRTLPANNPRRYRAKWKRVGLQRVTLEDFVLTVQPCDVWIIQIKHHYLVLHAGQMADNATGIPLPVERWFEWERSRPGCWVIWAIRVEAPTVKEEKNMLYVMRVGAADDYHLYNELEDIADTLVELGVREFSVRRLGIHAPNFDGDNYISLYSTPIEKEELIGEPEDVPTPLTAEEIVALRGMVSVDD